MRGKLIDLTGQRFGKLVVIERAEDYVSPKGAHCTRWHCKCDCGCTKVVSSNSLKRHYTKSCGCLAKGSHSHNKNCKDNSKEISQINKKQKMIIVDKPVDKVVDNMDNNVNNQTDNKTDNKNFAKAYFKFENWLSKEDKPIKIKSIMLYSVLKFANDMNAIDEDDMKKMYGEYMFKQMEQMEA